MTSLDQHSSDGSLGGDALGAALGPALVEELGGRLANVQWFKSSHQRGGAATAFAELVDEGGVRHEVVVKLPVGAAEHRWTRALSDRHGDGLAPTPRVLASGTSVGGHDLAWLVLERLQGQTLYHGWSLAHAEQLVRACAEMQCLAQRAAAPVRPAGSEDWAGHIDRARRSIRHSTLAGAQRWNESIHRVQRALPHLVELWNARPIETWCHGDLHPGNAMRRGRGVGAGGDRAVLIDLALVHAGHWVEDAVYLERQFWGSWRGLASGEKEAAAHHGNGHAESDHAGKIPHGPFDLNVVKLMSRYRRELGLKTDGDYGLLANVRRVLMAACAPAHLAAEGNPRYLQAALTVIDRVLPQIAHAH